MTARSLTVIRAMYRVFDFIILALSGKGFSTRMSSSEHLVPNRALPSSIILSQDASCLNFGIPITFLKNREKKAYRFELRKSISVLVERNFVN